MSRIFNCDEPTTGLDPEERIRIRNLLVDLQKNAPYYFNACGGGSDGNL